MMKSRTLLYFYLLAVLSNHLCAAACAPATSFTYCTTKDKQPYFDRIGEVYPKFYWAGTQLTVIDTTLYLYDNKTSAGVSYRAYGYPMSQCDNSSENYYGDLGTKSAYGLHYIKANPGEFQLMIFHRELSDTVSPEGQMDPPVIICQGFDPSYGMSGEFTFEGFIQKLGTNFIGKIIDSGHSVVLMKYEWVNDSIENNANAALKAFQWIQSQSTGNDLILVGPSMGGLIFRKALLRAAQINQDAGNNDAAGFHVRTFVAYDSPNWGAVIPMTLQAVARYLKKQSSDVKQLLANLTSPGASQMLLYQVPARTARSNTLIMRGYFWDPLYLGIPHTKSSKFLRELNSESNWNLLRTLTSQNGTPIRLYAVTDGSPSTDQGLPSDTKIASADYWTLYYRLWTGTPGQKEHIATLDALNAYSWKLYFQEPVFTENLPGSIRDSYQGTRNSLKKKGYGGTWNSDFLDVYDLDSNLSTLRGHAFIPTASAAGIRVPNYAAFNKASTWNLGNGITTLDSTQSWFDQVYINPYNQEHIASDSASPAKTTLATLLLGE